MSRPHNDDKYDNNTHIPLLSQQPASDCLLLPSLSRAITIVNRGSPGFARLPREVLVDRASSISMGSWSASLKMLMMSMGLAML